jgi:hypothetical protein
MSDETETLFLHPSSFILPLWYFSSSRLAWTMVASFSPAHYEHTIVITRGAPLLLTA